MEKTIANEDVLLWKSYLLNDEDILSAEDKKSEDELIRDMLANPHKRPPANKISFDEDMSTQVMEEDRYEDNRYCKYYYKVKANEFRLGDKAVLAENREGSLTVYNLKDYQNNDLIEVIYGNKNKSPYQLFVETYEKMFRRKFNEKECKKSYANDYQLGVQINIKLGQKAMFPRYEFRKYREEFNNLFKRQLYRLMQITKGENCGLKIVQATVHYEESVPHLHILAIPYQYKDTTKVNIGIPNEILYKYKGKRVMKIGIVDEVYNILHISKFFKKQTNLQKDESYILQLKMSTINMGVYLAYQLFKEYNCFKETIFRYIDNELGISHSVGTYYTEMQRIRKDRLTKINPYLTKTIGHEEKYFKKRQYEEHLKTLRAKLDKYIESSKLVVFEDEENKEKSDNKKSLIIKKIQ